MESAMECIFCPNILGPDTKPEHILLNGLGGRMSTRGVICSDCNNRFGGTIDDALTKQVEVIRNLLQLESGTGKAPPMLRNVQAGAEKITIRNDGTPKLKVPPFTVTELPGGRASVKIQAETEEELQRIVPHVAARLGMSEEEVKKQVSGGTGAVIDRRPDTVHFRISLGSRDTFRSATKACLVLFATIAGNEAMKSEAFEASRAFVMKGDDEFSKKRVFIDSRVVPGTDVLKASYGEFFNLIYVRSNSEGRVVGHFTLYNAIGWQIILAKSGGPPDLKIGLVSNPLNPADWSSAIADTVDIAFEWLDETDRTYELKRGRDRLTAMMQHHHDQALESEVGRIVGEVYAKHGITVDTPQIDPEVRRVVLGEMLARLAAHALHLPYEQQLTSDEMLKLLKGKSD